MKTEGTEEKQKKTRSPFGNIRKQKTKQLGKVVVVYDARKRYKRADGTRKEKFKCPRSTA